MQLEIYGSREADWSAHGDYEKGVDPPLRSCPFCGGRNIEVSNTHTPFYTAECVDCAATGPSGQSPNYNGRRIRTKRDAELFHRDAFLAAVEGWNTRNA